MDDDGRVAWLYTFGEYDAAGGKQHDVCKAVSYNEETDEALYMLEATSEALRPDFRQYT